MLGALALPNPDQNALIDLILAERRAIEAKRGKLWQRPVREGADQ